MLRFFPGAEWFAIGGLVAASAPVIIHLLNRRRFRTIEWAAMDFLRQALRRNRKILNLRDILLLCLRTACLALFGLAMARPYFSAGAPTTGLREPVHAVLLVDNSLSMGYSRIDGTLLDAARREAVRFIDELPTGSRVTVVPLCGSAQATSRDAYRNLDDARDAVTGLELVDRSTSLAQAIDLAHTALATAPDLTAKRCVLFSDQQQGNWPATDLTELFASVPDLQLVNLAEPGASNSWIAGFRLLDDLADGETPAQLLVTVRHAGPEPRTGVPVTLTIDGVDVASETIDLEPGQTRELRFTHTFTAEAEAGTVALASAKVSLPTDRLVEDNERFLAVPVVAALPILFVDQYGAEEGLARQQYGETLPLRRLLAPVTSRADSLKPLVQIKHLTIDQVTRDLLSTARLVVIAGVEEPGDAVEPLVEFVRQGGRLILAAGAGFDAERWQSQAWLDGAGLLPLPLKPEPVGSLPEETVGQIEPLFFDPQTMVADEFFVDEAARAELTDLYRTPLFFQAIAVDDAESTLTQVATEEARREQDHQTELATIETRLSELLAAQARGTLGQGEQAELETLTARKNRLAARWLAWSVRDIETPGQPVQDPALRLRPRILARLTGGVPVFVQRRIGLGEVLWFGSGLQSSWNDLARTHAVLLFDRILRTRLAATLPQRTLDTRAEFTLPLASADRRAALTLTRPSRLEETLAVDAIGPDEFALTLRNLNQRGLYTVSARSRGDRDAAESLLWETRMAVNGPESESDLTPISARDATARLAGTSAVWLEAGDPISLEGAKVSGQDLWKWLMLLVLVCLLLELAVIAGPAWQTWRDSRRPLVEGGAA